MEWGVVMRHVIYKNRMFPRTHSKAVMIHEGKEDKQFRTEIQKGFLYHIIPVTEGFVEEQAPEIFIQKRIDNKAQFEEFCFRVRGSFLTKTAQQQLVCVEFRHKLKIVMHWKVKDFSPKKSVTLT